MIDTIRNAFSNPEIRRKLLYTLMIIVLFRVGSAVTVPYLDLDAIRGLFTENEGDFLGYLNLMTGDALANATVFAMSITPYINASIIMQLLTVAIPALERLRKEGEEGRKTINKITRYLTMGLALIQALGYYLIVRGENAVTHITGWQGWFAMAVIIICFVTGTAVIVFMGELISQKGIGNGISIILFAGIISRGPAAIQFLLQYWGLARNVNQETGEITYQSQYYILVPLIVLIFIAMITFIIIMTNAERRIPVQYSKRVVGRKMYGGQSSHIPIKVSMSGVMPIIFASSIMSMPSMILRFAGSNIPDNSFWIGFINAFNTNSWTYAAIYFLLIIGFNYFYVAIQYNPLEISNNLRKNNGAIPGIRPGKPTSEFIQKVLSKITFVGAIFLGIIAVFPTAFSQFTAMNVSLGGTSILIVVGVALETMRSMESQMMMRHHKGFLE